MHTHLIAIETAALERWCHGEPSGFLEISAQDVVYFDPFLQNRLDGLPALTAYYENLLGKIHVERFEILNPHVHVEGKVAVLTYNFVSYGANEDAYRWNCTEVFRQTDTEWKLIQTHWSFTAK